jgi:hypothetical protein
MDQEKRNAYMLSLIEAMISIATSERHFAGDRIEAAKTGMLILAHSERNHTPVNAWAPLANRVRVVRQLN